MEALNNTSAAAQEREDYQSELKDNSPFAEDPNYLSEQLITYIGNKRALLGQIGKAVMYVKNRPVRSIFVSSTHLAVPVSFHAS